VKTCPPDPAVASDPPLKMYRLENELWFDDRGKWRRVDGKVESVCDVLAGSSLIGRQFEVLGLNPQQ
jgi:hypothetical protein